MFLPLAFVVGLGLNSATIVRAQVFALACDQYPDVCDNYSNGVLCHGIGTTLHYDANSGTTGNGDRRRTAVGCGSPNFCSGSGLQCDEYPYASTYDGGLGCFPAGFTGPSTELIQSGSTHCADGAQNGRHGQALQQFYQTQLNNQNSKSFVVAYQNNNQGARGPLGELIRTNGLNSCPDDSSGIYQFRGTPATPNCPDRMRTPRDEQNQASPARSLVEYLTARTESGMTIELPYYAHNHNASLFAPGKTVVTHDADGNIIEDRIVSVKPGSA